MLHLLNDAQRDSKPMTGDLIVVIPTSLLQLNSGQALALEAMLAEHGIPNAFLDCNHVEANPDEFFWIDLAQVTQEAAGIAAFYKGGGFHIEPGCRVNVHAKTVRWLHMLQGYLKRPYLSHSCRERDNPRTGTAWMALRYGVFPASVATITDFLILSGLRCIWQQEMPFVSQHEASPMPVWATDVLPLPWERQTASVVRVSDLEE